MPLPALDGCGDRVDDVFDERQPALAGPVRPDSTARGFVVPVDLATLFGAEVYKEQGDWIVRRGSQVVRFKPGVAVAQVGERQSELPSAPIELDGDLYVPLRFLGDFMGLKISIVGNTLDITTWSPLGMNRGSGVSEFVPVFPLTALEVDEPGPAGAQGVNAVTHVAFAGRTAPSLFRTRFERQPAETRTLSKGPVVWPKRSRAYWEPWGRALMRSMSGAPSNVQLVSRCGR